MSVRPIKGKKDTWQIATVIGYNADGSKKRKFKTVHCGKKQADALDAKRKAEVKSGTFLMNTTYTFEELSKKWLEVHAYPILAPKTVGEYERLLSIINPKIGHYKLTDIRPLTLIEFYNSMRNRPDKKIQLSESSIQKYYALINAI